MLDDSDSLRWGLRCLPAGEAVSPAVARDDVVPLVERPVPVGVPPTVVVETASP